MISRVQVSLTPSEAKRIIARGIAAMPEVARAIKSGKILLKGGTTVSAVAELLVGVPLRISGRISGRGALAAAVQDSRSPHSLLLESGKGRNVDAEFLKVVKSMSRGDVIVIGANAVDINGDAAMMAGSEGGGVPGQAITSMTTEGALVLIAAGLEKLIPGTIKDAVVAAGRKGCDKAVGMAVGLMPITGRLITEKEALETLARVKVTVIGKGGVFGGEGSTVLALEGEREETEKAFNLVLEVKGSTPSCTPESIAECTGPNPLCGNHLGCIYKSAYNQIREERI